MLDQKEPPISSGGERITISLRDTNIECRILDKPLLTPSFLQIGVTDTTNKDEVIEAIRDSALRKFWFLDEGIQSEQLYERFGSILDNNVEIDIYNFQNEPLSEDKLRQIDRTLIRYYKSLKDKSLWSLKSIQIRSQDSLNAKSGEPYRGKEFPEQHRFELFPASFEPGNYRNALSCSWVEAAVGHETTHVILENTLGSLWEQHFEELGWESLPPLTFVQLPGGFETTRVNRDYHNLPTEYASYQENDDRAESVVAFLFDPPKLNEVRTRLLNTILDASSHDVAESEILKKEVKLPELSTLDVYIYSIAGLFNRINVGAIRKSSSERKVITLDEYRKAL